MPTAQICRRRSRLMLFQYPDNLVLRETLFTSSSVSNGQTLLQIEGISGGKVKPSLTFER